jgi:hypothetical protein
MPQPQPKRQGNINIMTGTNDSPKRQASSRTTCIFLAGVIAIARL